MTSSEHTAIAAKITSLKANLAAAVTDNEALRVLVRASDHSARLCDQIDQLMFDPTSLATADRQVTTYSIWLSRVDKILADAALFPTT